MGGGTHDQSTNFINVFESFLDNDEMLMGGGMHDNN